MPPYTPCTLESHIRNASRQLPVVLVTGARQVSKIAMPQKRDIRQFQFLDKLRLPTGPGGVICLVSQSLPLTPTTCSIPIAAI